MTQERRTICNRDCPDACGIVATIDNGRVIRLQGDRQHPITRGFLCQRTSQFLKTHNDPQRLRTPLVRQGGRLVEVSWQEALDLIATKLSAIRQQDGPAAIVHYRSGGSLGAVVAEASELFFEHFGPVTGIRGGICSGAGEAAQIADFGLCDSGALDHLEDARNVLIWGKNVYVSSPHTMVTLRRARSGGARLTLIDPTHHRTASLCERFVQPRPGSDFSLAMAVAQLLFEQGWVAPDAASYCNELDAFHALATSRPLASWCKEADVQPAEALALAEQLRDGPTTILIGWGMARRRHGGAIVRALDALAAISGNLGIRGGGASYYYQRKRALRSRRGGRPSPRTLVEPLLGRELLEASAPAIRAVWITAANPVAMLPDARCVAQALRSRELVVVVDSWLSDTAELADVVLPTNNLLESDDLLGAYGHHHVGVSRPVVKPPAGVKSDLEIFQALAQRLDLSEVMAGDAESWKARLLAPEAREAGLSLEAMRQGVQKNPLAPTVLFEGRRFNTDNGKVNLVTSAPQPFARDPQYPLCLLSLSVAEAQCSQFNGPPPRPFSVTVHPEASSGIAHGEVGRLSSVLDSMDVRVLHDPMQRRDVAIVPKGGHLRDGSCANALTRAVLTDMGEGGALYDEGVRLHPLSSPP